MHFVLPHFATAAFWVALWKIMIANVILSGDNAVVIAMAARNLVEKHRRAAIIFGGAGAIVLLIIFCGLLGALLDVPYLKLVGGFLLLWIGIKLVGDEEEGGDVRAHEQLWPAIWSIAFANTVMSLDNAIAITAAANGDFFLMCMGLIISVPIIIAGAAVISGLLARFPWLALVGAGLIGWSRAKSSPVKVAVRSSGRTARWSRSCNLVRLPPGSTVMSRMQNWSPPWSAP